MKIKMDCKISMGRYLGENPDYYIEIESLGSVMPMIDIKMSQDSFAKVLTGMGGRDAKLVIHIDEEKLKNIFEGKNKNEIN